METLQCMMGRRMKAQRALLGVSQDWLAAATAIPQEHISRYERGVFQTINPVRLLAIATALQLTVDQLFRGDIWPRPAGAPREAALQTLVQVAPPE